MAASAMMDRAEQSGGERCAPQEDRAIPAFLREMAWPFPVAEDNCLAQCGAFGWLISRRSNKDSVPDYSRRNNHLPWSPDAIASDNDATDMWLSVLSST